MGTPEHAPLVAGDMVCNTCGLVMERKVVMGRREVDHIEYACQNADKGCNYKVERKEYCNLQPMMLKEEQK